MKSIDMLDDWTNMMVFAREHDLIGNDILVFSALCVLCHNGPWELNYVELSNQSGCGSRTTAKRSCDTLLNKHLVAIANKMVYVLKSPFLDAGAQNVQLGAQNVQSSAQNVQSGAQNVQFSEKERTKEKEIKEENIFLSLNGSKEGEREVLNIKSFIPPTIEDVFAYAKSMNFPEKTARAWFDYWEQTDWHLGKWQPKNWRKNLQIWVQKGAEIYASGMGMPQKNQKPMTQQEKDLEKLATDHKKEKALEAIADADYDANKTKYVAYGEGSYKRIQRKIMDHMAQNPKK